MIDEIHTCNSVIPKLKDGSTSANMKTHLKRHHRQAFDRVEQKDSEFTKKTKLQEEKGQSMMKGFFLKSTRKATASITKEDFISGILKMIVYDGVPLTLFQDDGFQLLNGDFAKNFGINLGHQAIRSMVLEKYEEERSKLKESISGALVFIKIDAVSRLRSHIIGISVHYYDKEHGLTAKTLALLDTEANHTGSHLSELLLDTLKQFNISKQQVLACIVDNASNMTRTVQLLNEDEDDDNDDEEIEEIQDSLSIGHNIHHMRCAEHTMQLGIRDVLKKGRAEKFLTKLRKLAQLLRSPHTDDFLKRRANKGMLIDMPGRWGSTFLMLQRLVDLKYFVQDLGSQESYLAESEWAEVKMMVEVLQIPHAATIHFQKQDLTPGECLLGWREVVFKLEKLDNNLASTLATTLQSRQEFLLQNEAFLAAVWIDSRSRILLSHQEQLRAKGALKSIFLRVQSTSHKAAWESVAPISDFDAYLNSLHSTTAAKATHVTAFVEALVGVERLGRLTLPNVWDIISKYPIIVQPVSRIVSCLPCTQVPVERMFPHLKPVFRDDRVRMGNELNDAIVFLRTNKSV